MLTAKLISKTFNVFNKIKQSTCSHYYIYTGKSKFLLFWKRHKIECLDCKKVKKFIELEDANLKIELSQKIHGANYRKLRNGLMEGDIDVSKLDI